MKQQITKEQWQELNDEEMEILRRFVGWNSSRLLNIGQMIEFLEKDIERVELDTSGKEWIVCIKYHKFAKQTEFYSKILVDCLWIAIKYKLNNKTK